MDAVNESRVDVKFRIAGTLSAIMTPVHASEAAVQFGIITPTYLQSGATSARIFRLRIAEAAQNYKPVLQIDVSDNAEQQTMPAQKSRA